MKKYKIPHFKKTLISLGITGAIVAPLATVVSCGQNSGNSYGEIWKFPSHNIVQITVDTPDGNSPLEAEQMSIQTPLSSSQSSNTDNISAAVAGMTLSPFRVVMKGFDENQLDSNGRIIAINPNRETAIRFEMADKVIFEFRDNTKEVFDNDTDGDYQDKNGVWHYSINGDHLQQVIKKGSLSNIRFHMRSDLSSHHWVQQLTGKSLAPIKAEDLWRGAILKVFNIGLNRATGSGFNLSQPKDSQGNPTTTDTSIERIDNAIISNLPKSLKNAFVTGTASAFPGIFFSSSYGLDGESLLKSLDGDNPESKAAKEKFIPATNTPENNEFVLPFKSDITGINALNFWNDYFVKMQGFGAVSDEQIQELIKSKSDGVLQTIKDAGVSDADIDKLKNSVLFKSGFYQWQNAFREEQFVAGKYYFAESSQHITVVKYNPDYIDPRWLNQKNSKGGSTIVKEFRLKYIQQSQASKIVLANEYKSGTSAYTVFDNFDTDQQLQIIENIKSWGVGFARSFTSAKMIGDYGTYSPFPFLDNPGNIYFNNNFAKLLYGNTLSNYKNDFTTIPTQDTSADHLWNYQMVGNGLQFRSNFAALFNGTGFLKAADAYPDTIGWPTLFAPEATIGKDAKGEDVLLTDPITKPELAAVNGVDEEKVLAYNVSNVGADGKIETHPLAFSAYLDSAVSSDFSALGPSKLPDVSLPINPATNKNYSPFEWVQKNIKESIDNAFGPLQYNSDGSPKVDTSNELIFEMPYGRGLTDIKLNKVYQKFADYLKTVDPRLKIVAAVNPASESASGLDATIRQEKWTDDFDTTATPAEGKPNYSFLDRLWANGQGYNFASIKVAGDYAIDSPASAMFDNVDGLQSGVLFTLSYLSNHIADIVDKSDILKPLKPVISFFQNEFNTTKASFNTTIKVKLDNYVKEQKLTSEQENKIMNALTGPDYTFENLYKSDPFAIAKHDFGGFYGLDNFKDLYEDSTITSIMSEVQETAGEFSRNSGIKFNDAVFASYSTQDKLSLMQSFEALFAENFQPFSVKVGDRRYLKLFLQKNWYSQAGLSMNSHVDLSWHRVDLDREDNSNPLSKVIITTVDENGRPIAY